MAILNTGKGPLRSREEALLIPPIRYKFSLKMMELIYNTLKEEWRAVRFSDFAIVCPAAQNKAGRTGEAAVSPPSTT